MKKLKKNHQNSATVKQPKAESGLPKQLQSIFHAGNSCYSKVEVKN